MVIAKNRIYLLLLSTSQAVPKVINRLLSSCCQIALVRSLPAAYEILSHRTVHYLLIHHFALSEQEQAELARLSRAQTKFFSLSETKPDIRFSENQNSTSLIDLKAAIFRQKGQLPSQLKDWYNRAHAKQRDYSASKPKTLSNSHSILDALNVGVIICTPDSTLLYANNMASEILKIDLSHYLQQNINTIPCVFHDNDDTGQLSKAQQLSEVFGTSKPVANKVLGVKRFDNHDLNWITLNLAPDFAEYHHRYTVISIMDTDHQARAQHRYRSQIKRLKSLLKFSTSEHQSEQELLHFAIKKAVLLTNSKLGYLHYYDQESDSIALVASFKAPHQTKSVVKRKKMLLSKTGAWTDAIRIGKPVILNHYSPKCQFPLEHTPVNRHLCIPIFDSDKIVAQIGVGNKNAHYSQSDLQQLSLFASNVWDIIKRLRAKQALQKHAEELESFNGDLLEREMRIIEFKEEVNTLSDELGRPPVYPPIWQEQIVTNNSTLLGPTE